MRFVGLRLYCAERFCIHRRIPCDIRFSGCLGAWQICCQRRRFAAYHEQGQAPAPRAVCHSGCPNIPPAFRQPES
ncbi:hypothetical protein [Kingella oralis]|uniref:hypothetical protein n=1 Tax=Kingella oralis TaxID=505 RepID=UPI0012DCA366|nr:hypothetical protein [Kingella oralis]QMT43074.1 hypothetical protein H3L93_01575 [Kingella oralis]